VLGWGGMHRGAKGRCRLALGAGEARRGKLTYARAVWQLVEEA
jgi:hypothetical protein